MTYTDAFERLCPIYMSYGMTYEQFWYGDPWMVGMFKDAYILKRRIDNENAWIAGAYVFEALTAALNNAFSKTATKYAQKPLDLFPKTKAEKESEVIDSRNQLISRLADFQAKFNAKHKSKGAGTDGPDNS